MASRKSTVEFNASMRIIVLHGREQFLIDEHTRRIVDVLNAEYAHDDSEIQRFTFDGGSCTAAEVLDELRSYSLMQTHKLVVLDNAAEFFKKPDDDKPSKTDNRKLMERYAESPVEEATLLIRSDTWRPGKIDKLIAKVGTVVKCDEVSSRQAISWVVARCEKRYEATIDRDAASLLVERLGSSLMRLDSELTKLASFTGADGQIDRAAVIDMVGLGREEKAWVLQAAVASGDPGVAIAKVRELREISQVDSVLIIWSLADLLKKIHAAARLFAEGRSPGAIASEIKLFGDARNLVLDAGRRLEPGRVADLLRQTLETVRNLRLGIGDDHRTLEALTALVADTIGTGASSRSQW